MTTRITRRGALPALLALGLSVGSCASAPPSRLKSLKTPTGQGATALEVSNGTQTVVNNLFLTPTAKVNGADRKAFEAGSPEQAELWGRDLLVRSALEVGGVVRVPVPGPGQYDIRVVARDGQREQHVSRLRLEAGGQYVLELGDGGWRTVR